MYSTAQVGLYTQRDYAFAFRHHFTGPYATNSSAYIQSSSVTPHPLSYDQVMVKFEFT
jgi:acetoacetate decarboxylase